ncbi:50S ribosomal protein L3 [Candidatus Woesearchaeota archaeon]|nr:50S ribosomal protein L3 [Candidatus Woesearchaeota archaeon]
MPTTRYPRRGSLQYWPRKRAKKQTARVRHWASVKDARLLGFAGYKAGMMDVQFIDTRKTSPTAKETLSVPCTVIECPPLRIFSIRFYKKTPYGLRLSSEILNPKLDKSISKKIKIPKKASHKLPDSAEGYDDIKLNVYTQPRLAGFGKKKPEIFQTGIGGSNVEEKLKLVKDLLDKEIHASDVFKPGQLVDSHSITKGKGFQGPVKRFGVKIRSHKSEKAKRAAILAPEGYGKVTYTSPMPGKMGYHLRTEHNKWIIKISDEAKGLKPFESYGAVKNPYILIKGSIGGPKKRLITLTEPIRPKKKLAMPAPTLKS